MDTRFKVIFDNLGDFELGLIELMQEMASVLSGHINTIPFCRESSLALTNLEQAMMWAIKAVCLSQQHVSLAELHRNE